MPTTEDSAPQLQCLQNYGSVSSKIQQTCMFGRHAGGIAGLLNNIPEFTVPELPDGLRPSSGMCSATFDVLFLDEVSRWPIWQDLRNLTQPLAYDVGSRKPVRVHISAVSVAHQSCLWLTTNSQVSGYSDMLSELRRCCRT